MPANTAGFDMGLVGVAEPEHTLASISAFSMGKYEVKYAEWIAVESLAVNNGYSFTNVEQKGGSNRVNRGGSLDLSAGTL